MFSLDTGRLPKETYDLIQEVGQQYAIPLQVYFPDSALVEEYVAQHGINGFYDSVENRKGCCYRAQGGTVAPCAGRQGCMDHRHAPRPGGDARHAGGVILRRRTTACRNSTRCWTGRTRTCGRTSAGTMCRTTSCTTSSIPAWVARPAHAPSRRAKTSAPDAGGGKTRRARSADCMCSCAHSLQGSRERIIEIAANAKQEVSV